MALISSSQKVPIASMTNKSGSSAFTLQKQQCHKEKVKQRLVKLGSGNELKLELVMIDKIQRLGIEHLFSEEIGDAMERLYNAWCQQKDEEEEDDEEEVYWVTLHFRLLRQQGYHVSAVSLSRSGKEIAGGRERMRRTTAPGKMKI